MQRMTLGGELCSNLPITRRRVHLSRLPLSPKQRQGVCDMGLLSLGTPLAWEDAFSLSEHVRTHGIEQFLSIWRKEQGRQGDALLWGDELEYLSLIHI